MIYLFSQIVVSLALAAIVGGAAGWLAHRARSSKQINQLSSAVTRQQQQVSEAQTQVSLLTGDFDDLKHQSEAEIAALKLENQKIPALNQNLEKSQLLVRQLMQQHKAESAEIIAENEMLSAKAKLINDREQAITKLQAELDIERRRTQQLRAEPDDATVESTTAASTAKAKAESQAELPLTDLAQTSATSAEHKNAANDQHPDTKSEASKANGKTTTQLAQATSTATSSTLNDTAADTSESAKAESSSATETEAELKLLRDQLAEDIPSKEPAITKPTKNRVYSLEETAVDEQHLEPLFDSVAQHDDLKQIFGIGPVTEKTLNKLGITAYSQLAELKRHDIEKIADALQIFPGRIERDNWVGGARAQLEEVLEDL